MADEELDEVKAEDPKEAKKAAKKAAKAAAKAAKKADKKNKKNKKNKKGDGFEDDEEVSVGGKRSSVLLTLLIIIIWLGILALLIKLDVGGFGSSVMRPILKDIPYLNMVLPEVPEEDKPNPDYPYATLADAIEQIKYLEQQIHDLQSSGDSAKVKELEAEVKRLKAFEEAQTKFETARKEYYDEVVFGNKSLGAEEYKKYYETIDPAGASELYKQAVQKIQASNEVKDYISTYANMKPKQAAALMEQMTDNMELVAKILSGMEVDARAKIMDAMSADFAAKITKMMEP